jgi:hypothetical protein
MGHRRCSSRSSRSSRSRVSVPSRPPAPCRASVAPDPADTGLPWPRPRAPSRIPPVLGMFARLVLPDRQPCHKATGCVAEALAEDPPNASYSCTEGHVIMFSGMVVFLFNTLAAGRNPNFETEAAFRQFRPRPAVLAPSPFSHETNVLFRSRLKSYLVLQKDSNSQSDRSGTCTQTLSKMICRVFAELAWNIQTIVQRPTQERLSFAARKEQRMLHKTC